jgi:hypothetical protein
MQIQNATLETETSEALCDLSKQNLQSRGMRATSHTVLPPNQNSLSDFLFDARISDL